LPEIPRIGISEFQDYPDKEKCLIKYNFIVSKNSTFKSYQFNCERGQEKICANNFINDLKKIKDIKAIEVCSAPFFSPPTSVMES